jgi:hypothetical protein
MATAAELPARRSAHLRAPARKLATQVRAGARRAAGYRLHFAVPAVTGAGLVSAGLALRFGIWAGLIAGGAFCLIFDHRIT